MTDARRFSPSTARNRQPILSVLGPLLSPHARVLEIASGAGEHAMYIARELPGISWHPTDPDPTSLASIEAHRAHEDLPNVAPARLLDVIAWPSALDEAEAGQHVRYDAVVCINMVHIAPWEATVGLCDGAAKVLGAGGILYLYGPYRRVGVATAPSNEAFDESLRRRDPRWGLRDLEKVVAQAASVGFALEGVIEMPANNLSVVLRSARSSHLDP
jgi:Protein of unknown function (DUF938)